jgi:protein N-terminal methyltransferase
MSDVSTGVSEALKGVYSSLAAEGETVEGRDSAGETYTCMLEMWQCLGVSSSEGAKNENWYDQATDYYEENCPETLDGVLGGFGSITEVDLVGSKRFVDTVQKKLPQLQFADGYGVECGAGIGRVSKGLLLPLGIVGCDLVESSVRLLAAAPEYIGDPDSAKCKYYCEGLQNWAPVKNKYSIIWVQWVLVYLTDVDIIRFLKTCGAALTEHGVICIKENTCAKEMFVLDQDDASVTRSVPFLLKLIEAAGLKVVHQEVQDDFPDELFDVPMIAVSK